MPSLTKRSGSFSAAPAARNSRQYSSEDKALFFESKDHLGSIAAAARDLGFSRSTATTWAKDDGRVLGTKPTAGQRAGFFVLLNRLGSVGAAARQSGINSLTAYSWSYSLTAGEHKPRRRSSARQMELAPKKTEFLAVLERVDNVTVAAREAGLKRNHGASGARVAGVENVRQHSAEKQAQYTRLRAEGATKTAAITVVGVGQRPGGGDHVSDLDILRTGFGVFANVASNTTISRFFEWTAANPDLFAYGFGTMTRELRKTAINTGLGT